jgi:hypothetical protein
MQTRRAMILVGWWVVGFIGLTKQNYKSTTGGKRIGTHIVLALPSHNDGTVRVGYIIATTIGHSLIDIDLLPFLRAKY